MDHNINTFINDLLHINSVGANKLLDLDSSKDKTFYLYTDNRAENAKEMISIISARIGKIGNTVLRNSALMGEQQIGVGNALDWQDMAGDVNPKILDAFIKDAYKEIDLKGNNPIFVSIGVLNWQLATSTAVGNAQIKSVKTPLIIFPVRLIRSVTTRPIIIEFVDDSIYVNPCLLAKLEQVYGEEIVNSFPTLTKDTKLNHPIKTEDFGLLYDYLLRIKEYVHSCRGSDDTLFSFDVDTVAVSKYNHDEICMYYDIQKHKDAVYTHPLVKRVFSISNDGSEIPKVSVAPSIPSLVLDYDSSQERMINKILAGESLIIKGPPGTGKTLTIANTVAALLSQGKKVMLVSKKPAALSEVYKKMPEELRAFLMLLDCETESQAANLSPARIKSDFASLLRICAEKTVKSSSVYDDRAHALDQRSEALRALSAYYEENFLEKKLSVLGYSYYEALEKLLENEEIKTVEYTTPNVAALITREQFNSLKTQVRQIGAYFLGMCGREGREHSPLLCPYYTFSTTLGNTDTAIAENTKLKEIALKVRDEAKKFELDVATFRLDNLYRLIRSDVDKDELQRIREADGELINGIKRDLNEVKNCRLDLLEKVGTADIVIDEANDLLRSITLDKRITLEEVELFKKHEGILKLLNAKNESSVLRISEKISALNDEIAMHTDAMQAVFRADLGEAEIKQIDNSYRALSSYVGQNSAAPRLLDLSAKKAAKTLAKLSYMSSPTFAEIVEATNERHEAYLALSKIDSYKEELTRLFRSPVDDGGLHATVRLIGKSCMVGVKSYTYVKTLVSEYDSIKGLFNKISTAEDVTLLDIEAAINAKSSINSLTLGVKKIKESFSVLHGDGLIDAAEEILAKCDFLNRRDIVNLSLEECVKIIDMLHEKGEGFAPLAKSLLDGFEHFGKNVYSSYYTKFKENVLLSDLDVFINEATDRNVISYSENYIANRRIDDAFSVYSFFLPFESGKEPIPELPFEKIFEHSTIDLALRAATKALAVTNGRGKAIDEAIRSYCENDKKIRELNVKIIKNSLIQRIDPKDKAFAFLNSENDSLLNLRKIFKNYSAAIMKLKSCFLLSPSTVSVLFAKEEFSAFDVVIVDEASQLEPTAILPILIRSNQCVFVGDEYQMPPITHFAPKSEHSVSVYNSDNVILPPETSLLNLAIQSNHFNVERLQCHFRSKTESLIAFSQKRYYPFMRTFPAPIPKAEGLGFKDIYISDGESSGGKNEKEARAVIRALCDHFDRCFDERAGKLLEAVGVVAFGESQLELITKYVKAHDELTRKIDTALRNFDDIPEKLIFFKTVETVQGQETDHLILSFTYAGTNNFGDLSRHSIGECIFNVAVTRARSSITMIHSIRYSETTNETISDFLKTSEKFASDSSLQFISYDNETGFIRSVKKRICQELGIPSERIVVNFGATNGSIRIPLVILSEDLSRALIGIYCERPISADGYIDESIRYYNILKSRGWELYRVRIHDWVNNREAEANSLIQAIQKAFQGEKSKLYKTKE